LTGRSGDGAKTGWSSSDVGGDEHETEWDDEDDEEEEEEEDLSSAGCKERTSEGMRETGGSMSMDVGGEERGV
jgi:hypothetical protein